MPYRFLKSVEVSLLTQRRTLAPFGLQVAKPGPWEKIRISVGVEHYDDIIWDINEALESM